jgi:DNA invertase Pin-like site-specific DNA recombinase
MKPAAVYLRVSKDEQELANQIPDCERLCAARGWAPIYFTEKESGAVDDRPRWRSVLEAARRGEVAAVVFWSIDRIGRNRIQVVHDLEELARWKVAIVSHQEPMLDVAADGPLRETLIRWWAWMAQHERERMIERTKAGLARARAEGKALGRPRTPEEVVRKILNYRRGLMMQRNGVAPSPGELARLLGVPRSTVRDVLAKNPIPGNSPNPAEEAKPGDAA